MRYFKKHAAETGALCSGERLAIAATSLPSRFPDTFVQKEDLQYANQASRGAGIHITGTGASANEYGIHSGNQHTGKKSACTVHRHGK